MKIILFVLIAPLTKCVTPISHPVRRNQSGFIFSTHSGMLETLSVVIPL